MNERKSNTAIMRPFKTTVSW